MTEPERVLIVGHWRDSSLDRRLREIDLEPVPAESFADAGRELEAHGGSIGAAIVPASLAARGLRSELRRLRRRVRRSAPSFVAVGEEPDPTGRRRLRSAGVRLGVWNPIDPATLRFQINRALGGDSGAVRRDAPRAPTLLSARVRLGERSRDARTYSLAARGAFLETARASLEDARLDVEIALPDAPLHTCARVMFSNVPGNLQCARLPLGMGVRFEELPLESEQRLRDYVDHRLSQLAI